ncbi:MAG: caspase family protein [Sulfuritalea sp.]|nr:caspase family protein [Sulfuritalea sp.]
MTNRRRFIQTLAAIPPAFAFRHGWAANPQADPSRLALIIGNSSYPGAPLINPVNDAKAIGGLFTQAGFSVDSQLDASRVDMIAAIERFSNSAKSSEAKLVVFYYAGHGAQLDWRNYLLPVDAQVTQPEHIKQRCIDLGLLLGQLSAAKDKTFIVILDACRNNPFGTVYRPERKGLSQFDAPVGSLLAYATAPGSVASDGEGGNGLYTENLVRELGKRGTRIEDALKRVRLNVRLASNGEQIPWETTSLENDVFIFNGGRKKPTEAELEQLLEADITEWTRIKSSQQIDDWVTYLRTFPNGRFAEIAQMRLNRLLAETEKAKAEKLAAEKRQKEEQDRLNEQKRIAQEQAERERARIAEAQRLAAERLQQEEQQRQELKRIQDKKQREALRQKLEQERIERDRIALERKREEEQRILAEQKRIEQLSLERERQDRIEADRLVIERMKKEQLALAKREQAAPAATVVPPPLSAPVPATNASSSRPASSQANMPASGPATLEIRAGIAMPLLIKPSANPYSAGTYPLGRNYSVDDRADYRQTDILTGIEEKNPHFRVTSVNYEEDRVEMNQGKFVTDLMGNIIKAGKFDYDNPVQWTPATFQVGKKWTAAFGLSKEGEASSAYYDMQIVARESIVVPAGTFDTFRIEGRGWNTTFGASFEVRLWLVPGVNFAIKREFIAKNKNGRMRKTERLELISLRQQVFKVAG